MWVTCHLLKREKDEMKKKWREWAKEVCQFGKRILCISITDAALVNLEVLEPKNFEPGTLDGAGLFGCWSANGLGIALAYEITNSRFEINSGYTVKVKCLKRFQGEARG
ncbi:Schizosaccharomyces pombe specific protein [Schizosaccharomyces pombe]|uniref:Uncharacterized protein C594.03 n=1 Tax=Schizosaccharomyces pombe (strain 972 / ATCC 24843) TaxID=284812 RepID=YJD3_SCHPO|nr:uncharacterized protein SPCC594.03 [Schizosaccharomyces pombe]O74506.1 RecName: Full=Uncharacterized protein C594.03 [Schizosaccharomyces pombe 972h-]CAA20662.1 sequence orphan [Schizosaccharomyces pombe]|eukprot:NP_587789.1 uncharacterized protein SPCC594.03 [Schizosaccharomyces pombe]